MANLKERNIALVSKDSEGVTTIDYPLTSTEMVEGLEEFVKTHSTSLTLPLPITKGGTGATSVAEAVKALLGSSPIGSSTKPLYYDGATLKACADSIGGGGIVAQLLGQNGYVKFANGLILQWGTKQFSRWESTRFNYPISMTTVYTALASRQEESAGASEYGCTLMGTKPNFLTFMGYGGTANIIVIGR